MTSLWQRFLAENVRNEGREVRYIYIWEMHGRRSDASIRYTIQSKNDMWHASLMLTTYQHASTDCTLWGAVNFLNLQPSICSIWKRQNFQPSSLTILDRHPQLYLTVTLMIRPLKNMTDHRVKGATEGVRNRATLGLTDSNSWANIKHGPRA